MLYNRYIVDEDMVYSIDYLQLDFCLGMLSDSVRDLLFNSFEFMRFAEFGKLDCSGGVKKLARYDLHWWQFSHFHCEVWEKTVFRDIGFTGIDEDGVPYHNKVIDGDKVWFLRMKFNPNMCANNPAVKRVLSFLFNSGWVTGWYLSRVDYALDVFGPIKDFYVLSRKVETNYGSTRYYGVRGSSGYLRVYDKRQEQKDTAGEDLGFELTRFEWEQRGSRDLCFTFDQFSRMNFVGLEGAACCLQYVSPENINSALLCFGRTSRSKIKKLLFSPVTVKREIFEELVNQYVKEFHLSGMRVFTDEQRFDIENGVLSPASL